MGSKTLQSVKGMNDILPPGSARWVALESRCRELFSRFGYGEVRTPILESTALFSRGIGEATDVVEKEMYTFTDRGDRSLTLRPEMTASCVRAYVQHATAKQEPVTRWYYIGPMFRYERMQTGRYRQFYQIGCEAYGVAEPSIDAEQIAMLYDLYQSLNIPGLQVLINSVGDSADRPVYRQALVDFLGPKGSELCGDCQRRLESNPLRILDCKVPTCKEATEGAPTILDFLGADSAAHFAAVQAYLDQLEIPYQVTPRLVRGLDYYTGTVFEMLSAAEGLGAQNTVVAGGRYDNLVESLGGPPTPAFGFSIGVERVLLSLPVEADAELAKPDLFIACRGARARQAAMPLAHTLRQRGFWVEFDHRDVGMKSQFKRADKLQAQFVLALGDDELDAQKARLRNMKTRDEVETGLDQLGESLARCQSVEA